MKKCRIRKLKCNRIISILLILAIINSNFYIENSLGIIFAKEATSSNAHLKKATASNATLSDAELDENNDLCMEKAEKKLDVSDMPLYENETYYIETERNLQWIREMVNSGKDDMKGKEIVLLEDIVLEDEWIPIGIDSDHPFRGNFNGNNKEISNITIKSLLDKNVGFFGYIDIEDECNITDLILKQVDIYLGKMEFAGAIIANLHGTGLGKIEINNCTVSGKIGIDGGSSNRIEGGIIGKLNLQDQSQLSMKKCTVQINLVSIGNDSLGSNATAGGLIGITELSNTAKVQIRRCMVEGEVIARSIMGSTAGGLIGKATTTGEGTSLLISQSGFEGSVEAQTTWSGYCDANAGGLIGVNEINIEVRECLHRGSVFCRSYYAHTGGMIGLVNFDQTSFLTMENILVDSDITAQGTGGSPTCGGVLGASNGGKLIDGLIENAFVTGTMDARNKAGIINWYAGNKETIVRNCYFAYKDLGINKDHVACNLGSFSTNWFHDSIENSYGLTSDEQQNPDSYIGWDLKRLWNVEDGVPRLRFLDYWMMPGYEESIYPKEVNDEYCILRMEFNDIVEMQDGNIYLYDYDTDKLIEDIYIKSCEIKNNSLLEIPAHKLPFDKKIYVIADTEAFLVGGKPFEGLQGKDDWVFYTKANGAKLTLQIIDKDNKPLSGAMVYAQHQIFTSDENGIARIYIQGLSQENLNDFILIDAIGCIRQSKKISDLGLDEYGDAYGVVTMYWDKDPSAPSIRYVSLIDEDDPYGCDIGQVIREYTTLESSLSTIKAYVDWRGNVPGRVYMEQKYIKKGEAGTKRLNLDNNSEVSVAIGEYFEKDAPIYLIAEGMNGKKSQEYKTYLKVVEGIEFSGIGNDNEFSLGKNFSVKIPNNYPVVGGGDIGFDFPGVPVSWEMDGNKIKIAIGSKKYNFDKNEFEDSHPWEEFKEAIDKFEDQKIEHKYDEPLQGFLSDKLGWQTKAHVLGYIEAVADDTNKKFRIQEGHVAGILEGKISGNYMYMLGPIPVFGAFSGGVDGKTELGMKDTPFTSMKDLQSYGSFEIKPKGSLGLGTGIPEHLYCKVEGSAELPFEITKKLKSPLDSGDKKSKSYDNIKIALAGAMHLKLAALIFKYEKKILEGKWSIYDNSFEGKTNVMMEPAYYQVMSRQYLSDSTRWNSNEGNLVKTNVYPNAEPKLMPYEDGQILMWIDDARERSSINRTKLMYALCDNQGNWSEPQSVCDDGTADFAFDMLVNDNKIYAIWQNIKSVLPEDTTLTEMANALEISAAVMELPSKKFGEPKTLSGSLGIKAMPGLMHDGENVLAIWTECSSDNYLLMDGTNRLKTCLYSEGKWKQENTIFETENTIVQLETDKSSFIPRTAFVVNMNQELKEGKGYELFLFQEGEIKRLSSDEVIDAEPRFAEFEGESALFTCHGNDIAYRKESSWENPIIITEPDGQKVDSKFQVFTNKEQVWIMYSSDSGKEDGKGLYALIYDKEEEQWGQPVQLIKSEGGLYNFSGFQDRNDQFHVVYMQMKENMDIADMKTQIISPYTDIAILGEPVYYPSDVKSGCDIPVMTKIINQGLKKVTSVTVEIKGNEGIKRTEIKVDLLPGEETFVEGNYNLDGNIIRQRLNIDILTVKDQHPENNRGSLEIGLPDISIERAELLSVGEDYMVLAYINNSSEEQINDVFVDLRLLSPDGECISEQKIVNLDRPGMKVISLPMKKEVLKQTQKKIVPLYIIAESNIEEAIHANNREWITIENPYMDESTIVEQEMTKDLDLDWIYYELSAGEIFTLHGEVYPDNLLDNKIQWQSSSPEVAEVSSEGVVSAKKPGTTKIIATAFNGEVRKECVIDVVEASSDHLISQEIELSEKEILLTEKEQSYFLNYFMIPESDVEQTIVWKSSDASVAIVNQEGIITAKGNGMAEICAVMLNGKTAVCKVTVKIDSIGGDEDLNQPVDPDKDKNPPVDEPPADEDKPSVDENKPSTDQDKPSADENKPSTDETKPSTGEDKKPTDSDTDLSGEEAEKPAKPTKPAHSSSGEKTSKSGKSSGNSGENGQWMQNKIGWWYQYKNGTYPVKKWMYLPYMSIYEWYYFDERGYMLTGWQFIEGKWYYLHPISDGTQGRLYINTITPDGYKVGMDGAWIP